MPTLRDEFPVTHQKKVKTKTGEISLTYISWSQVADRLDEAAPGWSFSIRQLGDDWCWGQLTIEGRTFDNIGYAENADEQWKKEALKDAVSDALKRCAALAGVGRYLYDRDAPAQARSAPPRPEPVQTAVRSSTTIPDDLDIDFDSLPTVPPERQVPLSDGENWCPVHGLAWKLNPAGTSKATGKAYGAFWACSSQDKPYCKEKPTRQWLDAHQPVAV